MTCKRCNLILIALSHANCDKNNSSLPLNGEQSKLSFIHPFSLLKNISLWRLVMLGWYFVHECWCKHTESNIAFDAITRWNYLPYIVKLSVVIWEPDQIPIKTIDEKFYLCGNNYYWLYILFLVVQVVVGYKKLIRQC